MPYFIHMLKIIEKLIDRHIRDEVLPDNPLLKNQYTYQPDKSSTHDLPNLVNGIAKGINSKWRLDTFEI